VERFAMLRYGVNDLRAFFDNDVRFLRSSPDFVMPCESGNPVLEAFTAKLDSHLLRRTG
jgi:hypothetical protein